MPMFFFDTVEQDGRVSRDVVGVELADSQHALATASRTLLDSVQENGMSHINFKVQVIVRDESGHEIGRRDAAMTGSNADTSVNSPVL